MFLILVLLLSIFEWVLPVSLGVVGVVLLAWRYDFRVVFAGVFLLGLAQDFVQIRWLGATALFYLLLALVVWFLKERFKDNLEVLLAITILFTDLLYRYFFRLEQSVLYSMLLAVIAGGLLVLVKKYAGQEGVYLRK